MDLRREEFRLDAKITELRAIIANGQHEINVAHAQAELPNVQRLLKDVQHKLYGWRHFDRAAKERMLEKLEALRRRVLQLENEAIELRKIIDNYDFNVERQKKKIAELQGHLASGDIGYIPKPEEIEKANEELIEIHNETSIAQINLPGVEKELAKAKAELQKLETQWEKAKKHSDSRVFESPGVEIDQRSKEYASKHRVSYKDAMAKILKSDPILSFGYLTKK